MVRKVTLQDADQIAGIYNYYILNSVVTFEEVSIDHEEMKNRIKAVTKKYPWIVYEEANQIIGYAYATNWKSRCAYKNSVETSVYLKYGETSKGVGTILYQALLAELQVMKLHSVIGGIALPNNLSIRLHEKLSFQKIAHFKEVGYKFEKWVDVGYWQLLLNSEKKV